MNKNIFILGPVASGKNSLMNRLSQYYDMPVFDSGKLFRAATYLFINNLKLDIEIKDLYSDLEKQNITFLLNKNMQKLSALINKITFDGQNFKIDEELINEKSLYSKEVNSIISCIAKEPVFRKKIISLMNEKFLKNGNYILTGHSLKEIDTTKFITIFLDVNDDVAAHRLFNRERNNFATLEEALTHLQLRNQNDKILQTKAIIKSAYNIFIIDTNSKDENEVFDDAAQQIDRLLKVEKRFKTNQQTSIPRDEFIWITNPIFDMVKIYLDSTLEEYLSTLPCISKTDLEYQVLIKLASYSIDKILIGDSSLTDKIENQIIQRDVEITSTLFNALNNGFLTLNIDLINDEIIKQAKRLINFYNNQNVTEQMALINSCLGNKEYSLNDVHFEKLDSETSEFIAKNCHYLHSPRNDEYVSYAGFLSNIEFPIAWVSYSLQDRDYKKQLLYEMGIEPQYTLEMTRAWCSNSAPKNIMSSLFQFSFNEIKKTWPFGKNFVGISTTINPNLSFKASSFLGSNFITCALRPARYTYKRINGEYEYTTRRNIDKNEFIENNIPIYPLNEMFMCLDTCQRENLRQLNIFNIDKKIYDSVMEEKINENTDCLDK